MVDYGAESVSQHFSERPLEISKDKYSRDVLQSLNDAATEGNAKDLKYLVNCGEIIDEKMSITGEAPIHKAVLSLDAQKTSALNTIIKCNANLDTLDANGWTALHHAAYTGDLESSKILLSSGAQVDAFSNMERTALHFASMKGHVSIMKLLLDNGAALEAADEQNCTPLHLGCKKGALESVSVLLAFGANIYALDIR